MAIDVRKFKELKARVEELTADAAKAQGAFEQSMKELKETYGCNTLEEAFELHTQFQADAEEAEAEYEAALEKFETKWAEQLDGDD